jgi:hypothetical protein
LEELSAAFGEWRSKKKYAREQTPEELVRRARSAASVHGVNRVAQAVRLDRHWLVEGGKGRGSGRAPPGGSARGAPSYSRVEMVGPVASARPFAELEMPSGIRLRLYSSGPETMGLLSSMCGLGGGR